MFSFKIEKPVYRGIIQEAVRQHSMLGGSNPVQHNVAVFWIKQRSVFLVIVHTAFCRFLGKTG